MEYDVIMSLVRPDLVVLVAVLWCVGALLKRSAVFKDEWAIPLILLTAGIVLTFAYMAVVLGEGWGVKTAVLSIVQGVLIASVAVFSNELVKQILVKREVDRG